MEMIKINRLTPKIKGNYEKYELCGLYEYCTGNCYTCNIPDIIIKLSKLEDYEEKVKERTRMSLGQLVSKGSYKFRKGRSIVK